MFYWLKRLITELYFYYFIRPALNSASFSPSSACRHSLLDVGLFHSSICFHICPFLAVNIRFPLVIFRMSSRHLSCGLPTLLFVVLGLHGTILFDHLEFLCRATCPAQRHFRRAIRSTTSVTLVRFWMTLLRTLSRRLIPNIALSMDLWHVLNLLAFACISASVLCHSLLLAARRTHIPTAWDW